MTLNAQEKDVRISILNSIMKTPHREIAPLIPIHTDAEKGDPLFYVKLGIWYKQHGDIKDHAKVFAAKILASPFYEFRAVGEKLLSLMPMRDAEMAITAAENSFKGKTGGVQRRIRKVVKTLVEKIEDISQKDNGVRLLRNSAVIRNLIVKYRIPVKYPQTTVSLHFRTKDRKTGDILPIYMGVAPYKAFDALRSIKNGNLSEKEICTLIDAYSLPPMQIMGTVKELTPAIAAAMLKGMSSAETVNYMKMFERKGLTNIKAFTDSVKKKVTEGPKSASASMRSMKAAKALSDGEGSAALATITDDFVKKLTKLKKNVVLAIDKSWSMSKAITLGKELATILAAIVENPSENLRVCVYDSTAKEIKISEKNEYSDFEARFRYIQANGTTALGSVIKFIDANKLRPDCVIFIGDAEETDTPLLKTAVAASDYIVGAQLINLKVGTKVFDLDIPKNVLVDKTVSVENMIYDGDYYSIPNILKIITKGGIKETIAEIDAISIEDFINTSK